MAQDAHHFVNCVVDQRPRKFLRDQAKIASQSSQVKKAFCRTLVALLFVTVPAVNASSSPGEPALPRQKLAADNFGADAPWYLRNIPFFEIDDPEIQQIYYYRWKLFRAHIREIGPQGTTVLEFLENVPWARQPYTDLNDSASFHIMEGRWLRDPAIVDSLIDHLYRIVPKS